MKPFNLEAARQGAPVQTRDGGKARIVCFDAKNKHQPIVALIEMGPGGEVAYHFSNDGKFVTDRDHVSHLDMVMAPAKREGWINIYKPKNRHFIGLTSSVYETEEKAKSMANGGAATIKIEWEE